MSIYLSIMSILLITTFMFDVCNFNFKINGKCFGWQQLSKYTYFLLIVLLWVLAICRYGQGADYFIYADLYEFIYSEGYIAIYSGYENVANDIGWRLFNYIFTIFDFPFEIFISFIATFQIVLLNKFINKYCWEKRLIALLMIYPVFYLTYVYSAFRQGLAISLFIGVFLSYLEEKRYWRFFFSCLLMACIHKAALLYLFCFIAVFCKDADLFKFQFVCVMLSILFFSFNYLGGMDYIGLYLPDILTRSAKLEVTMLSSIKRLFILGILLYIVNYVLVELDSKSRFIYKIVLSSIVIYFLFSGIALLAGRFYAFYGEILEIIMITMAFKKKVCLRTVLLGITVIGLSIVVYCRNINAEIYRSYYCDGITLSNFPYISIFEKEDFYEYRYSKYYR